MCHQHPTPLIVGISLVEQRLAAELSVDLISQTRVADSSLHYEICHDLLPLGHQGWVVHEPQDLQQNKAARVGHTFLWCNYGYGVIETTKS